MSTAAALAILYLSGYVTGSLLIEPRHDRTSLALGTVRLLTGLMLTTIGFLLSLELSLPGFSGPIVLLAIAGIRHRAAAFLPPRPPLSFSLDGIVAGLVAAVVLAPPVISAMRMASGSYPPVFLNVDVPYFLEKVYSLVTADLFPPESLGVADGRRPYHFGLHGLSALLSRGSGMAPHQVVFLIVVPLLTLGIVAAAVVLARAISPALPLAISVPLLTIATPTLWYDFWSRIVDAVRSAFVDYSLVPIDRMFTSWEMWGITSNIQNVAGHFLVLASLGAIARAETLGWWPATFLVGSAVIFKSPTGVALAAGFACAQAWRALTARSVRPLIPAAAAALVFGAVYLLFWILPGIPTELSTVVSPGFYLEYLRRFGGTNGFVLDVAWLLLPALLVLPGAFRDPRKRSLPLLIFAITPFIVVNVLRLVDERNAFGVSPMNESDWRQIMMPAPLLLHAFVLSVAGSRWARLGVASKTLFALAVLLAVIPPALAASRYSEVLVVAPHRGYEFVDNRPLADALATIPTTGTMIVTNDIRYPAENFQRADRQMQIPALFGHQAFAVNYVYEGYPFSRERRELQKLLQVEHWTSAIDEAARAHHWTHLLIHKNFVHPQPIPLERIYDGPLYSVFKF